LSFPFSFSVCFFPPVPAALRQTYATSVFDTNCCLPPPHTPFPFPAWLVKRDPTAWLSLFGVDLRLFSFPSFSLLSRRVPLHSRVFLGEANRISPPRLPYQSRLDTSWKLKKTGFPNSRLTKDVYLQSMIRCSPFIFGSRWRPHHYFSVGLLQILVMGGANARPFFRVPFP